MDIAEIRRQNLLRWIAENGTPVKERSLFSQLKADGSFGERVARRLEEQYRMGSGYLDRDPSAEFAEPKGLRPVASGDEEAQKRIAEEAGRLTGEFLARAAEMIETYRLASPADRERIDHAFGEARSRIGARDKAKPGAR